MNNKDNKKESVEVNKLTEKVVDITKLIIPRGMVLLEVVEPKKSNIILPEGYDKTGLVYYKVIKTGNQDFKKVSPEFIDSSFTRPGNIAISLTPSMTPVLTNKDKEYLVVSDHSIQSQVTEDNFMF